jgi:mono/diheme cytochrome c family protein
MKRIAMMLAAAVAMTAGAVQAGSVNDGVYSAAQAQRGHDLYDTECARCHGPTLGGAGGGPAISGPFWTVWDGRSLGALFNLTRKSMPADGPGRLGDQDYADILAYMLSVNRYPAGQAELPAQVEALKSLDIVKRR